MSVRAIYSCDLLLGVSELEIVKFCPQTGSMSQGGISVSMDGIIQDSYIWAQGQRFEVHKHGACLTRFEGGRCNSRSLSMVARRVCLLDDPTADFETRDPETRFLHGKACNEPQHMTRSKLDLEMLHF